MKPPLGIAKHHLLNRFILLVTFLGVLYGCFARKQSKDRGYGKAKSSKKEPKRLRRKFDVIKIPCLGSNKLTVEDVVRVIKNHYGFEIDS